MSYQEFKGYRGNTSLKGLGVDIEWTPELIQEYARCKEDPIYFCRKYIKVVHVDRGLVPLDLYPYQEEMIKSFINNRNTIVATARQAGKTTAMVGFALHYVLFNDEKVIGIIANKGETARKILGRIQKAYENLPKWLQQGVKEYNKGSFILENGSKIFAGSTTSDSIRGDSLNAILIDECAFVEGWDEFQASTMPVISSGKETKIILVSTPKGLNHFHSIWTKAEAGKNNYNPIKVLWQDVPGRDAAWKASTLADLNGDTEKFAQEFEVEFQGSSGTLINGNTLKNLVEKEPLTKSEGLLVYENPVGNHSYAITCDVSRGKGLDYSAFSVIDITQMPYKQVCTFKNNIIPPSEYADVIFRIGNWYNCAAALVEINDIGEEVVNLLAGLEYENVLYTENGGARGKRIAINANKAERGLRTTTNTKAVGCSVLKLLVEQEQLIINDYSTIYELSRFSKKGRSYEAEEGANDDLVMSLVIFAWLTSQAYFKDLTDINTMSALRERTKQELEDQLAVVGLMFQPVVEVYDEGPKEVSIGEFDGWLAS